MKSDNGRVTLMMEEVADHLANLPKDQRGVIQWKGNVYAKDVINRYRLSQEQVEVYCILICKQYEAMLKTFSERMADNPSFAITAAMIDAAQIRKMMELDGSPLGSTEEEQVRVCGKNFFRPAVIKNMCKTEDRWFVLYFNSWRTMCYDETHYVVDGTDNNRIENLTAIMNTYTSENVNNRYAVSVNDGQLVFVSLTNNAAPFVLDIPDSFFPEDTGSVNLL